MKLKSFSIYTRRFIYAVLGGLSAVMGKPHPKIVILCYHSFRDDNWNFSLSVESFKKQIEYLSENFDFISLKELSAHLIKKTLPYKPSVVLTFDDGYKSVLKVKNIVKSLNIRPTLFLLSNPEEANRKELKTDEDFLSIADIELLVQDGWEIGSHSRTHSNLRSLTKTQISREVIESKNSLEHVLGSDISYFSYPRGRYNKDSVDAVIAANYVLGLSMDDGIIDISTDLLKIPRIGVVRSHSFGEFCRMFSPLAIRARMYVKKLLPQYAN